MLNFFIGKFLFILAFSGYLFSIFFFFLASWHKRVEGWFSWGKKLFYISSAIVMIAGARLMYLILSHQFAYNYVKHYSSTDLNIFYLISTFYAGQEGSFLLWLFYGSLIGFALLHLSKTLKAEIMFVVGLSQAFLVSMLLGLSVPGVGTIGSDPFALTTGVLPIEGDGLNPLLQNPWMVIHPPTLFAGFSLIIVPFAYAIAGLWKENYTPLIREATTWTLAAAGVLGTGIMMGGYWAYGVLGWGGYWGWDPVENSSLSPWLVAIALIHNMLVQRKNNSLTRLTFVLAIMAYVLVLYSAFLTRSGALADYSVHSFTDLGLYGQLLLFVLTFFIGGLILWGIRFKKLGGRSESFYISKEFFLLVGSLIILLVCTVVTAGTSAPLINRFITDKPDPILPEFYNTSTLPLAIGIAFFSAFGQLIWWSNEKKQNLFKLSLRPFILSALVFIVIFFMGGNDIKTGILVFGALFSFFASIETFLKISFSNLHFAGGTISHLGLALMLIGFISTSQYAKSKKVELTTGKTVSAFGKHFTFQGLKTVGNGKTGFEIAVVDSASGSKSFATPVLYETKRMNVQNPDILTELFQDIYISPQNFFVKEHPNELLLSQNSPVKQYDDYEVAFLGFNYDKTILQPTSTSQALVVVARIEIKGMSGSDIIEPTFEVNKDGKITSTPVTSSVLPAGSSVSLTNIDATSKSIMLSFSGTYFSSEPLEVFVADISIKPFINVLWLGTITLIIGIGLSIYRRQKRIE